MTTPSVIFIDIDGVMIPTRTMEPSPEAFEVLKLLRGDPPCPLVLISTWRVDRFEQACEVFTAGNSPLAGVASPIVSKTHAIKRWLHGYFAGPWTDAIVIDDDAHRFADEISWATCISPDPSQGLVMEDVSELLNAPMGRKGE